MSLLNAITLQQTLETKLRTVGGIELTRSEQVTKKAEDSQIVRELHDGRVRFFLLPNLNLAKTFANEMNVVASGVAQQRFAVTNRQYAAAQLDEPVLPARP